MTDDFDNDDEAPALTPYAIRLAEDRQVVGIFVARDLDELAYLVDQCTDPSATEYLRLGVGGVLLLAGGVVEPQRDGAVHDARAEANQGIEWGVVFVGHGFSLARVPRLEESLAAQFAFDVIGHVADLGDGRAEAFLADAEFRAPIPDFIVLGKADAIAILAAGLVLVVGHWGLLSHPQRGGQRGCSLNLPFRTSATSGKRTSRGYAESYGKTPAIFENIALDRSAGRPDYRSHARQCV